MYRSSNFETPKKTGPATRFQRLDARVSESRLSKALGKDFAFYLTIALITLTGVAFIGLLKSFESNDTTIYQIECPNQDAWISTNATRHRETDRWSAVNSDENLVYLGANCNVTIVSD